MGTRWIDIHSIEEMGPHEVPIALGLFGAEGVVFVEVESRDVRKAQAFLAVQADELRV